MVITFRQKNPLMPTVRLRYGNSAELYRPASLFRLAIGCSIYYGRSPCWAVCIGGGAGGAGGTAPPNDGVGGTMHSGPPNSDTSGP